MPAEQRICWRCGREPRDSIEATFWLSIEEAPFEEGGNVCVACQTDEEMAGVRATLAELQADYHENLPEEFDEGGEG